MRGVFVYLTHLLLVPHICVAESDQHQFGSDNGLLPIRHQAIILTNAGILSIEQFGSKFSENASENNVSRSRPFCQVGGGGGGGGDRNWIKENHIIQYKTTAISTISNSKPSYRLTSMTWKLHKIGGKFSKTWQDTVVSRRDFRHSWVVQVSNVILEPMLKVVQPVVTDRNRSYYQSWNCSINGTTNRLVVQSIARPVAWLVSPRSWYDPARLVTRSCTTCSRFLAICNRRSRVLNITITLAATKFAGTITHDF